MKNGEKQSMPQTQQKKKKINKTKHDRRVPSFAAVILWNNRHWITLTDVRSFPKKLHNGVDQDSPKTDDGEKMKQHQSPFPPTCGPIVKYKIARAP